MKTPTQELNQMHIPQPTFEFLLIIGLAYESNRYRYTYLCGKYYLLHLHRGMGKIGYRLQEVDKETVPSPVIRKLEAQ